MRVSLSSRFHSICSPFSICFVSTTAVRKFAVERVHFGRVIFSTFTVYPIFFHFGSIVILYIRSYIGFILRMQSIKKADCIRQTFRKLNLTALAKQSGFRERKSRKISPLNFVLALLAMASKGALSLGKEAELIGFLANRTISRQAVQKCAKKATAFMTLVLLRLLELKAYGPVGRELFQIA